MPLLLIMPQSSQARLHTLPVSSLQKILGDFTAKVVNPSYSSDGNPFDHPPRFTPDSYYGFNPYMDLRSRGNLSDDVVLKVRSDNYDFYVVSSLTAITAKDGRFPPRQPLISRRTHRRSRSAIPNFR